MNQINRTMDSLHLKNVLTLCLLLFLNSCFTYVKIPESKLEPEERNYRSDLFEIDKKYLIRTDRDIELKLKVTTLDEARIGGHLFQQGSGLKDPNRPPFFIPYENMFMVKKYKFRPLITIGVGAVVLTGIGIYQVNNMNINLGW
ncbi:hypothetical protein SAMN06295967_10458 [Belliella buryatensis]|uniref:Uncharacterized protein n=1 Tax=Belliella buryatensis TaxID=1500549 RepID=A0A239C4T9_9BACT|nr:hypothetical protein [Belliella buryatensis]SNS14661.1 hypothetical protein SAMN06295967_10458 [Belliella buryatensis]